MRYSVRSSDRVLTVWITSSLNIITWIERRTPAPGAIGVGQRRFQIRTEHLEVDRRSEGSQLITEIAQPLQSIIESNSPA
jgi:hypothetical protein